MGYPALGMIVIPPMRPTTPVSKSRSPGTPVTRMNGAPSSLLVRAEDKDKGNCRSFDSAQDDTAEGDLLAAQDGELNGLLKRSEVYLRKI
jgi:hypothetical protein